MIELAAAAALTFCSPSAAQPTALADGFLAAFNKADTRAMAWVLTRDASLNLVGHAVRADEALSEFTFVAGDRKVLTRSVEGDRVVDRVDAPRVQLRRVLSSGETQLLGPARGVDVLEYRVRSGCIVSVTMAEEQSE